MFTCNPPALISMDGDYYAKINLIHAVYRHDFTQNDLYFNGKMICRNSIPGDNGWDQLFWHLISRDDSTEGRLIDYSRCARIAWSRYILMECVNNCALIKIWAKYYDKTKKYRIYIWCEKFDYIIVLEKRNTFYQFITAFITDKTYKQKQFNNEYNIWSKTKTPI